jgi:hypothetical protein
MVFNEKFDFSEEEDAGFLPKRPDPVSVQLFRIRIRPGQKVPGKN